MLPPNRLRLLNPIQALQAFLTLQLARSGWSKRLPEIEALLPGVGLKHPSVRPALRAFVYALMSRCIAAGRPGRRPADQRAWRWTLEDAWRHPLVLQAWQAFAREIDASQAEALLARAAAAGLSTQRLQVWSNEQATDGWALGEDEPLADEPCVPARAVASLTVFGRSGFVPAVDQRPARAPLSALRRLERDAGAPAHRPLHTPVQMALPM